MSLTASDLGVVTASFLASGVELVEALTIVLAMGVARSWRAALWGTARLVVTPDAGPMHLAAALALPAIVLLQSDVSRDYAPRGEQDRTLVRPTAEEATAAIMAHPLWPETIQATD